MADNKRAVGSVTYHDAEHGYFERRKLRRHAAFWSLWALGVGAVISGDFYGWNLGLDAGGFGGLLIAGIVITIMYYGLCYSIAEMSPALPHTGGAYSFSRSAMGPWGGFITGLGREHGIRHHPRGRRGRDGIPLARHRFRPDRSRRVVEQPGSLVGDLLHHLRRDQHPRHRDHHAVHRGDHRGGARHPRRSSSLPCSSRGRSTPACSPTSHRKRAAAASCPRASPESSPPCPSRSGSTWRSRNCRWPPKSLTIRSGTSPVRRSGVSTHWSSSPFSPCS